MKKNDLYEEIFRRFGAVTRARNCFLYTKKGVRLTDLFQENGRAILGWEGGNSFTFLKNTLNRGQVGGFITEDKGRHYRLEKAVSQLLSERKVFIFSNKKDAVAAGLFFSDNNSSVWKPWLQENIDWSKIDSVIIQPPLPWTDSIYILAVKTDGVAKEKLDNILIKKTQSLPSGTIDIPFALEAALTKSIYNMIAELKVREEKNWFIYDSVLTKYWTRKGPYLYPKIPQEAYDAFVFHCLECELVINPDYNAPSIIPFGADKGVFTKLKNNPFLPTIK